VRVFIILLTLAGMSGQLKAGAPPEAPALAASSPAEWRTFNPVTRLDGASFAHPPDVDRPWVRLNMPADAVPSELQAELIDLHDKGIAGIEVGQGAFPDAKQLVALLSKANELGIKVSLSHGPTQSPPGYSVDDDHARKTLAFGNAVVPAGSTFDGPLPPPRPPEPPRFGVPNGRPRNAAGTSSPGAVAPVPRSTLIAVVAYRCVESLCKPDGPSRLDPASAVDVTALVSDRNVAGILGGTTAGHIRWSPPGDATNAAWQLIAFWARGVYAQPDPFSAEGFRQLTDSLAAALSPEVTALMKANGGDIFYDSHSVDRGSPDELWTNQMAEEFAKRRGYALIPELAALYPEFFSFSDGSAARVRNDFYAVRGSVWLDHQITPLRTWVRKYNYLLRVQPEGEMSVSTPISDQVMAAAALDRPEHESLFANDEVDNYLPIASANHVTGNSWYSTECCAALNMNYAQTFQDMVIRMHRSYAGGITRLVYHVYPYRDGTSSRWPGYHNFGPAGFSNAWGPRDPNWTDARIYNDYFARMAQVLSQGNARTDIAVYMQNYLYPQPQMVQGGGGFRIWRDTALQEAGYTRDYLDPELLSVPGMTVAAGRLAPNGPAYKALVIDAELQPATDPDKRSMPLPVIEQILSFARTGLPVIIVAAPPDHAPGNAPDADLSIRETVSKLLAEPSVHRVPHEADVPGLLRSLGIQPSAKSATGHSPLSMHRHDAETKTEYYFLYNEGVVSPKGEPANLFEPATGDPLRTRITLEGQGRPYLLDAWSGEITPIVDYTVSPRGVTLSLNLSRDNASVIALSDATRPFGQKPLGVHVLHTTADGVVERGSKLLVRASKAGSFTTALSNGRLVTSWFRPIAPAINLTGADWQLAVEDWQPANPYSSTFGIAATQTQKVAVRVALHGLRAWPTIPELRSSSGICIYSTTFTLPPSWRGVDGAVLELGEVFDTFVVGVNGHPVTVNQLSGSADIGRFLQAGKNSLTVRVSTTLNNRQAVLDDDVSSRGLSQPYGLVGPVTLLPYREAIVYSRPRAISP
jgi:alpha-L-rhamnosidase/Glycosyl hydrolases family 2, sugar binding domain